MALDGTYSGLQASIADWLVRTDLAAAIPDFVALVDADLNSLPQRLRLQETDQPLAMTVGSRFIPLPVGYLDPLSLWIEWPWGRECVDEGLASELGTINVAGRPYTWCVDGSRLAFDRPADQAYNLTFRMSSKFGLAASLAPSLYVLSQYSNVYLYGSLLQSAPYLKDDDRLEMWSSRYGSALQAMMVKEGRSRSGALMRVDPGLHAHRRFSILTGY